MTYTLKQLAEIVSAKIAGDENCEISSVATLKNATPGQVSFLTNSAYRKDLEGTAATAVILTEKDLDACPCNALVMENSHAAYSAYARIAAVLHPARKIPAGIHPSAVVADDAIIHETVGIGPNSVVEPGVVLEEGVNIGPCCVIGANSHIGANTQLVSMVTINYGCIIGQDVLLHPGVVIGADGFGQANDQGEWIKVPQIGKVIIGDRVEIGANTTVDRGTIEDTVIANGVKLDNLIQVAHNVHIGEHTLIAACTAIAGSTHIGKHCTIAGCVGIVGHLNITDNVYISGMSMVTKSISKPGSYSSGLPAEETSRWHKNIANIRLLGKLKERVKKLESAINNKLNNN